MKMKKILIIATVLCLFTGLLQAQDDNQRGGRIEALKIAYLTKKLELSPAEAQKFWPIYNQYAAEMKTIRVDQRQNKLSELQAEDRTLAIRKKYNTEFEKAISPEKVNTFFRSEKEFGQFVQKELQERRQQRNNGQ